MAPSPSVSAKLPLQLLLASLLLCAGVPTALGKGGSHAWIGVNYGGTYSSSNPVSVQRAIQIIRANKITAIKIFSPDPLILNALKGSGLEIITAAVNGDLQALATSPAFAQRWVDNNILPYFPKANILAVAVGNEVFNQAAGAYYPTTIVPAMWNMYNALRARKLHRIIKVVSPMHMGIFQTSYPPSATTFVPALANVMTQMLAFLRATGSYMVVNAYGFFPLVADPQHTSADVVLFTSNTGYWDNGHYYQNIFDAMMDGVVYACQKVGYGNMGLVVGEVGWPTAGASVASSHVAQVYNSHLIGKLLSKEGTPLRPGKPVRAYLFEMFDEDRKSTSGGAYETSWGIFTQQGQPKYPFSFTSGVVPHSLPTPHWCVANPATSSASLLAAYLWACSVGGVDCSFTLLGGSCSGATYMQKASAVFNAYYQSHQQGWNQCSFSGAARVTFADPSVKACHIPGFPQ